MNHIFDTQQIYRDLADKGGFTDDQAQILTDALRDVVSFNFENLATKSDLRPLRDEIRSIRQELKSDLQSHAGSLRSEMKLMQQQLTIRLGGIMVVGIGVLAALMQVVG